MLTKVKIYMSNLKGCLIYYFGSAVTIYVLNMSNKKSVMITDVIIDKSALLKNIFLKNTLCFLWVLTAILFGHVIIKAFLIANGVVLGLIASKLFSVSQFLIIIPHGIFEIGALILTCCIVTVIIKQKSVGKYEKIFLLVAYLIIIQAAFIEAFLTTSLIKYI